MKNWPLVQNARTTIAIPLIRVSHQMGFTPRSRKARIVHQIPTVKNRKPRTWARPAKVSFGLMKQMTPATRKSTRKMAHSQRIEGATAARTSCWTPVKVNITPTMTPTVVIDAWSNCRTTSEAATHATPTISHSHHSAVTSRAASRVSGMPMAEPASSGVVAGLLMGWTFSRAQMPRKGASKPPGGRRASLRRRSGGVGCGPAPELGQVLVDVARRRDERRREDEPDHAEQAPRRDRDAEHDERVELERRAVGDRLHDLLHRPVGEEDDHGHHHRGLGALVGERQHEREPARRPRADDRDVARDERDDGDRPGQRQPEDEGAEPDDDRVE